MFPGHRGRCGGAVLRLLSPLASLRPGSSRSVYKGASTVPEPHEHLFQPGHALAARHMLERGWPASYLAVCVLCGEHVDLIAALSR